MEAIGLLKICNTRKQYPAESFRLTLTCHHVVASLVYCVCFGGSADTSSMLIVLDPFIGWAGGMLGIVLSRNNQVGKPSSVVTRMRTYMLSVFI